MKVLVTGASGFVGGAFLARTSSDGHFSLRAAVRTEVQYSSSSIESVIVEGLTATANWHEAVKGCDAVVHAAARTHIMQDTVADPLSAFRLVNVQGTLNLARQAAESGVKRFVFLSSVKVNGELTQMSHPFRENDIPAPQDSYAISKHEAEEGLSRLAKETGMEVVVIRPPLVYGPGVKANFQSMIRWVRRGTPLPFGAVSNKRSFVALDNLVDFILTCLVHPKAANQTFLVADGEDFSTPELLQRIGLALGKPMRLLPIPSGLLQLAAGMLGKRAMVQRLCGSLQVDISKARELLDWTPPLSVDEGLRRTVGKIKP
jgi:nucleoside-diphosphate-sugar epimerase